GTCSPFKARRLFLIRSAFLDCTADEHPADGKGSGPGLQGRLAELGTEHFLRAAIEAAAAGEKSPDRGQAILPGSFPPGGAYMFDEAEIASRPENPVELPQTGSGIPDGAENEGRNNVVEDVIR